MNLSEVEKLLELYDAGETSEVDEASLNAFFQSVDMESIPAHLHIYAYQFKAFADRRGDCIDTDVLLSKVPLGKDPHPRPSSEKSKYFVLRQRWAIAACISFLVIGTSAGYLFSKKITIERAGSETAILKQEIKEVKQLLMFSLLEHQSASERIKAVSFADELPELNNAIAAALFKTLNEDANVNVRLAALNRLSNYTKDKWVREQIVASLKKQHESILQITIIDILVRLNEKSAHDTIEAVMNNKNNSDVVRKMAMKAVHILKGKGTEIQHSKKTI